MKCIILAGGHGDRLWPLSRKNYPKQFIRIKKSHSLFQEAIARNIPFCDEFIIVTGKEYEFIVENQMNAFQGTTYRCIYEEIGRKTTAAILMACMELSLSELVFVVPTDHLIEGESYRDSVLRAKELCRQGYLVTLGMPVRKPDTRFGYICHDGEWVRSFVEKPDEDQALKYMQSGDYLINAGMFLFRAGDMLRELKLCSPEVYDCCIRAYEERQNEKNGIFLPEEMLRKIPAVPIEKSVFEKTKRAMVVPGRFFWKDIGTLEDLESVAGAEDAAASMPVQSGGDALGLSEGACQIQYRCKNTGILNQCANRAVVANGLTDTVIVNTRDAVYVGRKGESGELKRILEESDALRKFYETGGVVYRKWGTYEILVRESNYVVRKLTVHPGKTIYAHKHMERTEHWSIVEGTARVTLDGRETICGRNEVVRIVPNMVHQLSNIGMEPLIFIETSVGEHVREEDLVSVQSADLTETELGFAVEPFVRLQPAYKDFLWGGTRLKEQYGKQCEYDIVAESWELSAHPSGQSVVASGRHRGQLFGDYLETIGKKYWGWKCQPLSAFPILIKFIDARDKLSVQVHPGDEFALEKEGQYGKNEMWYIVDCEPEACIYCGFKQDVTKQDVEKCMEEGTILTILNRIPVQKGESYFIPSGTVHAIGAGIFVCEIQQSSDCTYRLYDFERRDKYGNQRALHLDKALQVLDYHKYEHADVPEKLSVLPEKERNPGWVFAESGLVRTLSRCKYFECVLAQVKERVTIQVEEESFVSAVCIRGAGSIRTEKEGRLYSMDFQAGDSLFLPAESRNCRIEATAEGTELILTRI
ncbi:MAG: cupin domain-containing protein [Clostridiales bacterium]|nr:cupin domain-containing protein [Clostridiales bacterium]